MPTLTVVIPAFNEAERLPDILRLLAEQTTPPDAIVVADAGSADGTREVAEAMGASVVVGGKPGPGRNAGAAVATTDLILFLDADNSPTPDFIQRALEEFARRHLDAATCHMEPLERDPLNLFACEVGNLYLDVMQYVQPHAPGFCILVRRSLHELIGGFDESIVLAEDHDYVQRAAEHGKFRVLRGPEMATSMRRIEKEGILRLAFMYVYSEANVLAGRPMRELPFEYEFGVWDGADRASFFDTDALREWFGRLSDRLERASADGVETLRKLGSTEIDGDTLSRFLGDIAPEDLRDLVDYARERLRRGDSPAPRSADTPE